MFVNIVWSRPEAISKQTREVMKTISGLRAEEGWIGAKTHGRMKPMKSLLASEWLR